MKNNLMRKWLLFMCVCTIGCMLLVSKSEAASSKYYIKVNKNTNVATVYYKSNNKPYKAFLTSCGKATPTGTFYTKAKYKWRPLYGNCYGQYATRITGSILFHSVWYYKSNDKSTLAVKEYNKLGTTASHGCVRVNVEAAKWIYDNCNLKTKVIIYKGSSKSDPLGKPKLKKITSGKRRDWDPTDPDKKNPYNKFSIKGVSTKNNIAEINKKINVLKGVSATTKSGRKLTSKIKIKIKEPGQRVFKSANGKSISLTKAGTYEIKYTVKDSKTGITKNKTIKYKCNDPYPASIIGVSGNKNVEYNSSLDLKTGISVTNASKTNLLDKLEVYVRKPGQASLSKYGMSTILFDTCGLYIVQYKIINPNNDKVTIKEVQFNCVDTKVPIVQGYADAEAYKNTEFDVMYGVSARTVSGIDITNKITTEIISPSGRTITANFNKILLDEMGNYKIKYIVTSPYGVKAEVIRNVIVEDEHLY